MKAKIRLFFITIAGLGIVISLGCGKPPVVKYRVKSAHIKSVDPSFLRNANEEKDAWSEAKIEYRYEKKKLQLRKYDYILSKLWLRLAKLRAKRIKTALTLKNKKIPVKLEPGAYAKAREDLKLAKLNYTLRKLQYKFHKNRVKLQKRTIYTRKAQYMEELVEALYKSKHKASGKYRKYKYAKQSAKLKLKMARVQEKVELAERKIKKLKKQVEPHWHPSIVKRAAPAPKAQPPQKCPPCPKCPKCPKCPTPEKTEATE